MATRSDNAPTRSDMPPKTNDTDEPEPTEEESKMTEDIAKDRPTIDAAVKSFISMVCARSMAASNTDMTSTTTQQDKIMMGIIPGLSNTSISSTSDGNDGTPAAQSSTTTTKDRDNNPNIRSSIQQQVLQLARLILRAVNSYTFPVHDTVAFSLAEKPGTTPEKKQELLEISVVARLWNALEQSDQKVSRFLGRRALKLSWKNLNVEASLPPPPPDNSEKGKDSNTNDKKSVRERQLEWLQQFEVLLFQSCKPLPSDIKVDDDSALLWAPDGGAAELAKRRERRLSAAKERGPSTPS